jgi:catechol 2,3-dioxygenase-like lactoylglutathione lyase family enzyme
MMLTNDELRVVLVSIHVSLAEAIHRVTIASVRRAIDHAVMGAQAFGVARPRVAVAGLNPHAGENGLFGPEDDAIVRPAIEAARAGGIDATGPWPPDTVFMKAREGHHDIVVALYHDQGLIPVKYLGVAHGVNVTLGLPFVRTSPDHGTAFDIAWKGIADASSLAYATRIARRMIGGASPETPNPLAFAAAEPQLFVTDVPRALRWFESQLGFARVFAWGDPPTYAQVARGLAKLNLRHVDGSPFTPAFRAETADALSAAIPVDDVDRLHLEFRSAGAAIHQPPRTEPWGARTLIVADPDGNLILFAAPAR